MPEETRKAGANPTVYVDAAVHAWRGSMWCHLFCSDLACLHEFAARLGLRRAWFQCPPKASWPHYDTIASRRASAIAMGAVAADRWTTVLVGNEAMVAWCAEHRPDLVGAATARRDSWIARAARRREISPAPAAPLQGSLFLADGRIGG